MDSLRGHFLIASPRLHDPNFFRTVVLIIQHTESGAMGVVLNRPTEMTVQEAWRQVSSVPCDAEGFLHQGGPCEGPLMAIHTDQKLSDAEVLAGLYFCTDRDSIHQLIHKNRCPMRFFVGYSGWAPGQLDAEMEEGAWLATPATVELVFASIEDQWNEIYRAISRASMNDYVDPKINPEDPTVN